MSDRRHPNPDTPAPPSEGTIDGGFGAARVPQRPRPEHGPIGVDAGKAEALGMRPKGVAEDKPAEKPRRR
ncbi:hypothetical protein [Arenibaculum pallidiluteum]|uniref:hypothetical protein n=1 Tax=Arenibaculum pallidiluteum TaxID=2812559 RepID=UPI001A97D054|nr:hypothetical protein [Arenibaculum pallidiluteum]